MVEEIAAVVFWIADVFAGALGEHRADGEITAREWRRRRRRRRRRRQRDGGLVAEISRAEKQEG